jgi:hypothetical protein
MANPAPERGMKVHGAAEEAFAGTSDLSGVS